MSTFRVSFDFFVHNFYNNTKPSAFFNISTHDSHEYLFKKTVITVNYTDYGLLFVVKLPDWRN